MTTMTSSAPVGNDGHWHYLDWLRVIAILILLFYHVGMMFVSWGWHIQNGDSSHTLEMIMGVLHRLRMPLLFVISGAGTAFALRRRSAGGYAWERAKKLFLPLVFGMFVIVPPQIYWERLFRHQFEGSYVAFYPSVLDFVAYPAGSFSWHHLWFIAYLFIYSLILLPLFLVLRRVRLSGLEKAMASPMLFLLALPLGFVEWKLRPLFPETHNLTHDWYLFCLYLLMFFYGFLMVIAPASLAYAERTRRGSLAVVVGLYTVYIFFREWIVPGLDSFLANLFTWCGILAMLGYGRKYLVAENALLSWAREVSYPFYIVHQTVIVGVGFWVLPHHWNLWLKFSVSAAAALGIAIVLVEIVRRIDWLRPCFGMKTRPRNAAPSLRPDQNGLTTAR